MRWRDKDVRFSFLEDMSWHPIVTVVTSTPIGDLHFMAELELSGRTLICRQVDVQGPGANEVGIGNLMVLAQALMREWILMDSALRERFERLGPVREIERVTSGSPAAIVFKIPPTSVPRTIDATMTLARRGMSLLKAKRAVEASMVGETVCVALPCVEDVATVLRELTAAGFEAAEAGAEETDVRALRTRLGLTREAFALRYGLEIETVRNWEIGKREPDRTARSYLQAIANRPDQVAQAYGFAEEKTIWPSAKT